MHGDLGAAAADVVDLDDAARARRARACRSRRSARRRRTPDRAAAQQRESPLRAPASPRALLDSGRSFRLSPRWRRLVGRGPKARQARSTAGAGIRLRGLPGTLSRAAMRDTDDEIREIKTEIIESRGLIIKTNNLTNSLAADIKSIAAPAGRLRAALHLEQRGRLRAVRDAVVRRAQAVVGRAHQRDRVGEGRAQPAGAGAAPRPRRGDAPRREARAGRGQGRRATTT